MKFLKISLLLVAVVFFSCDDKKPKQSNEASKSGVLHYYCENNCENSGGDATGNCPTCSTPYTHNQAWHDKDFLKAGPLNVPKDKSINPSPANTSTPSPAQNAKGVFHYTCTNGCNGGAGSAAKCKSCGNDLAHNTAYHN